MLSRRGFLGGFAGVIAAPAIVRVSSIMPVRALPPKLLNAVDVYVSDWGTIPLGTPVQFEQGALLSGPLSG